MTTTLAAIEQLCNQLLEPQRYKDASYNGIQVDTPQPVSLLATGVTASEALILEAAEAGAQAVLVHHGIFWTGVNPAVRGSTYKRVRALMSHQMGLLGYHLPLDAHGELGNNIQLARALGLTDITPWGSYHGMTIGYGGTLDPPRTVGDLLADIERLVGRPPLHLPGGPDPVRRVAVVSGGAAMMAPDAARDGYECFLMGEPTESSMHFAVEEEMHVVAGGHHATETLGARALGERVAAELGIEVMNIDLPNPV